MKQITFKIDKSNIFNIDVDLLTKLVKKFLKTTDDVQQVKRLKDVLLKLAQTYGEIIILLDPKIKKELYDLNRKDKQILLETI